MNEKIGVIVPVYKTEKYVAECIESILAQTYTNFRLILVDDGTPDGAGAICDEYATKDQRITVIHQENAGVTRARARGVEEAADCEWITFVDSDDSVTNKALENLLKGLYNKSNIVIIDFHKKYTNKTHISIEEYRLCLLSEKNISSAPWGKLIHRTLFNKETFSIPRNIIVGEDLIMNLRLAFNTNEDIHIVENNVYNYRENPQGVMLSHTKTIESEEECHKYKISSIPQHIREKYVKATIPTRLLKFRTFWGYCYNADNMKKARFYHELKADIKHYNYKLPFIDRIIFNSTNIALRFICINIKKMTNLLYSAIFLRQTN